MTKTRRITRQERVEIFGLTVCLHLDHGRPRLALLSSLRSGSLLDAGAGWLRLWRCGL